MKMKIASTLSSLMCAGMFFAASSCILPAQIKATTHKVHKLVSITGCLAKGDEAGEYAMKTSDGKLYGLTSRHVRLKDHVGHTVTLGGYIIPESAEKGESPAAKSAAPSDIDMTVSTLKMISTSCQQ